MRFIINIAKLSFLILLLFAHVTHEQSVKSNQFSLVGFVNPLVGSDSDYALSNGNTYPAIALPWGMNFWTPLYSFRK